MFSPIAWMTYNQWVHHGVVFAVAVFLFLAAKPLLGLWHSDEEIRKRVRAFRTVIFVFWILQGLDIILFHSYEPYENNLFRLGKSIAVIYACSALYNFATHWTVRRYGDCKKVDGDKLYVASYSSRMADVFALIIFGLISLYCLIQIWELSEILKATGFLGIIFVFLALTNAIWAPDVYFGLVVLNSKQLDIGDTFYMDNDETPYILFRINFIYTVLLDVSNNHRTVVRNSLLFKGRLDNLTKRAAVQGLRRTLDYKIGYPDLVSLEIPSRKSELDIFLKKVESMFTAASDEVINLKNERLRRNAALEWNLYELGDHAIVFRLSYYLEPLPSTQLAQKIRQHLFQPHSIVNNAVYRQSILYGIRLETPVMIQQS